MAHGTQQGKISSDIIANDSKQVAENPNSRHLLVLQHNGLPQFSLEIVIE